MISSVCVYKSINKREEKNIIRHRLNSVITGLHRQYNGQNLDPDSLEDKEDVQTYRINERVIGMETRNRVLGAGSVDGIEIELINIPVKKYYGYDTNNNVIFRYGFKGQERYIVLYPEEVAGYHEAILATSLANIWQGYLDNPKPYKMYYWDKSNGFFTVNKIARLSNMIRVSTMLSIEIGVHGRIRLKS